MPLNRVLSACAVLTLLTACAHVAPVADGAGGMSATVAGGVPAQWAAPLPPAGQPVQADWWRVFHDEPLTGLVTQALQANTSVRTAQAALQQARALRDVAQANQGLTLGASGSAQRSQVGDNTPGNTWRAGLDARWEADVFGRLASATAASQADVQAAVANVGQVRVSLAAEVATNYIELRGLQARLAIARQNLVAQQDTLQLTDWRVQVGLASSIDLEQARAAVAQTQAQLPALDNSLAQTVQALAVLTGQPLADVQRLLAHAQPVPQPDATLALAFPADTLRQRPDVRTAEHRIQAAWARLAQADAARYPSLSLSGSLGLGAARWSDLFDITALTRTLLASVSGTLWDGGAARAQVQAQQAALEQARIGYEATVLAALQDVKNALNALRYNRERMERLQAAAQAASNANLLARQRYASGLIDFRTVLDTQRTLLSAQSELETARATHSADHVRLYKALGGGWTPSPDGTVATASGSSAVTPSAPATVAEPATHR